MTWQERGAHTSVAHMPGSVGRQWVSFLDLPQPIATHWMNATEIYSFAFLEIRSSKSRCWQGHAPFEAHRGNLSLLLPASGYSRHFVCIRIIPVSDSIFTWPSPLCASLYLHLATHTHTHTHVRAHAPWLPACTPVLPANLVTF